MAIDFSTMAEILRDIVADRSPEDSEVRYTPALLSWRTKQTAELLAWQELHPGALLAIPAELEPELDEPPEPEAGAAGEEGSFRKAAAAEAGARWSRMDEGERRSAARAQKTSWLEEALGGHDQREGFGVWLARQPRAVQDDVLGRTRAKLFRDGGLSIDRFTDPAGRPFTLEQLAATRPEAFVQAGLDPEDFDGDE